MTTKNQTHKAIHDELIRRAIVVRGYVYLRCRFCDFGVDVASYGRGPRTTTRGYSFAHCVAQLRLPLQSDADYIRLRVNGH